MKNWSEISLIGKLAITAASGFAFGCLGAPTWFSGLVLTLASVYAVKLIYYTVFSEREVL
jgi:lipoprotein signal peptidase